MKYNIEATVTRILERGECPQGHKVGDRWLFDGKTPAGLCATAADCLFPIVQTMRFGATPTWAEPDGSALMCCSDPKNPVVFQLRRVEPPQG